MRQAFVVCVIALLAGGALIVIATSGRIVALSVGGAVVLVGVPLMALARVQIGRAFAVAPKAKALVTHGLYARIPHPIYVFFDLTLLGVVIALRQPWLVAPWLALVAIHAWAARREARVLERAFGDAYRQYRAKTWW
ncbi:MAG: methyltransferase [Vicinamibacterales bacterium]